MAPGLCESEPGAGKEGMSKISEKQQIIIDIARSNGGQFTTSQIMESKVNDYFSGASRYISAILKAMVDSKKVIRIKNGVYRLITVSDTVIQNQPPLF